jgi:hypothetical protein
MLMMRSGARAAWICFTLILCAEKWNAFSGICMVNPVKIAATQVQPESGFEYETKLDRAIALKRISLNRIYLFEDRQAIALFSPRQISVCGVGRGIFTIQNDSKLVFSTSDNSDPRTNGRSYFLHYPMVFPQSVGQCLEVLWVFLGIFCLTTYRGLAKTPAIVMSAVVRCVNLVGRHPVVFLALPSAYFCLNFTPLWKGVDAIAQLIFPAGELNILHFTPLYCFAGRIPFWLGNCFDAVVAGKSLPSFDLWTAQRPSLSGLWLLILSQHIALIGSLTFLVKSVARGTLGRGLVTLILVTCSGFYAEAHSGGTDSLSQVMILLLCNFGLRIVRGEGLAAWTGYSVALLLASVTRQIDILFSGWLVASLFVFAAVELYRRRKRLFLIAASFLVACAIPLFVAGAMVTVQSVLIRFTSQEYRSTLGRTLSDRVGRFLANLPTAERDTLQSQLQEHEKDHWAKRAIALQDRVGTYYSGMGQALADEMRGSGMPAAKIGKAEDEAVLESGLAYLSSLHPRLLRVIWKDFKKGFNEAGNFAISRAAFSSIRLGGLDRDARPEVWEPLNSIPNLDLPTATALEDRAKQNGYFRLQSRLVNAWIYSLAVFSSVFAWLLGKWRTAIASLCLLLTGASIYFVSCCLVYYTERYTIPAFISGVIAVVMTLGASADALEPGSRVSAQPGSGRYSSGCNREASDQASQNGGTELARG